MRLRLPLADGAAARVAQRAFQVAVDSLSSNILEARLAQLVAEHLLHLARHVARHDLLVILCVAQHAVDALAGLAVVGKECVRGLKADARIVAELLPARAQVVFEAVRHLRGRLEFALGEYLARRRDGFLHRADRFPERPQFLARQLGKALVFHADDLFKKTVRFVRAEQRRVDDHIGALVVLQDGLILRLQCAERLGALRRRAAAVINALAAFVHGVGALLIDAVEHRRDA